MLNIAPLPKPKPVKVDRRKKRKKKTNRQLLERQADSLIRDIVLKRDRLCVCPAPKNGHTDVLQNGHLITRGRGSVRYDLKNCNAQCSGCNSRHEHFAEIYTLWYIREHGAGSYEDLVAESENVSKLTVEQLQALCDELTAIKARQEADKDFVPRFSQKEVLAGSWRKENGRSKMQEMLQRNSLVDSGASGVWQHDQEDETRPV